MDDVPFKPVGAAFAALVAGLAPAGQTVLEAGQAEAEALAEAIGAAPAAEPFATVEDSYDDPDVPFGL